MYSLGRIIDELMEKEDIKIEDIPNIDLYMDQVLTLFDKCFPYNYGEQELTKTMINNYAKGGIIKPAVKKKYNKEHILMIIMICILKRNISLSEIKDAVDMAIGNEGDSQEKVVELEKVYKIFLDKKNIMNEITRSQLENILSKFREDDIIIQENKMLDVLILCYYSNILSEAARAIIRGEE